MRWPRRRKDKVAGPVAASVASDSPTYLRASGREWATLPPLKSTIATRVDLTVPARRFVAELAASRTLVHRPSTLVARDDAPVGLLHGVATVRPAPPRPAHEVEVPLVEASPLPPAPFAPRPVALHHSPVPRSPYIGETDEPEDAPRLVTPSVSLPVAPPVPIERHPAEPIEVVEEIEVVPVEEERPARRSLAEARRLGLGPAYHGPLPEAIAATRTELVHPPRERVPDDVRTTMRDTLGVDVGDRDVHRGPEVSKEARALGARAFSRDGEVFVPAEEGPLDRPETKGLVAHELTHAAQQIANVSVPEESTLAGRVLEEHARAAERFVRGDAGAPRPTPELLHPTKRGDDGGDEGGDDVRAMMQELIDSGAARSDGSGGLVFTLPASSMLGTQRATATAPASGTGSGTAHHDNAPRSFGEFGQQLLGGIQGDLLSLGGSLGIADEIIGNARNEAENERRRPQRDEMRTHFQNTRLEHRRAQRLRDENTERESASQEHLTALPAEELQRLENEVREEVDARMRLLTARVDHYLEVANEHRTTDEPITEVNPDHFDQAWKLSFENADGDAPTGEGLDSALGTQALASGTGAGTAGGARPGAGPGAATGGPAGGPTGAGGGDHRPPVGGSGGSHAPSTTGARTGTGAGHGAGGQGQHDGDLSHITGFRQLGLAVGGGLLHDVFNLEAGMFGLSDELRRQGNADIESSLHPPHAAGAGAAGGTGAAAPGAHGADAQHGGAPGGARDPGRGDPVGARPNGQGRRSTTGREVIDSDHIDVEDLAGRLYPIIRSRLRTELLVDRERAGLLTDFR